MTSPPAGWYPDPGNPQLQRWWNGTTWTPRAQGLSPFRPRLGRGWFTLSVLVENTLRLLLLVNVAFVALDVWGYRMFGAWLAAPERIDQSEAELYDAVTLWLVVAYIVLFLLAAGLFITWLFRAHRSDRMYPVQLHHASGWAIGGWFVPILNLWRPVQMVIDVRRGASDTGWAPTALVRWWWAMLLVSAVVQEVANDLAPSAEEAFGSYVENMRRHLVMDAAASVLLGVAAVLAIMVVRSTVELVRESPHARTP